MKKTEPGACTSAVRAPAKKAYVQYETQFDYAAATEGLRICLPTQNGYINYDLVHSVKESISADLWRIGRAFTCDGRLETLTPITTPSAEWDMAIRLEGRDDSIGGYAHGDEAYVSFTLFVDGKETAPSALSEPTPFTALHMVQDSIGYDPNDHVSRVLLHHKEWKVTAEGITLCQRIEWLNAYTVKKAYLAMMPPMKAYTDHYCTDLTPTSVPCNLEEQHSVTIPNSKRAVVHGEHLYFEMAVPRYPEMPGGNCFLLTDNGGAPYNKMYFRMGCGNFAVERGDIWETETVYRIEHR